MTTSGTSTFSLDLNAIVEEAFERCGSEVRTGYDLKTARRSLNLLTMEWANRGVNLWTVEQGAIPLVAGTASYTLPAGTVDLLDYVLRTGTGSTQSDLSLNRISVSTYAVIPNKNSQGRPQQLWVDRAQSAPAVNIWPVPDRSTYYTLVYWRLRRIQDAGYGVETSDVPFRFIPCLVAGLAYYLSMKMQDTLTRTPMLKSIYDEQWELAADEDREKAPLRIVPRSAYI
jgi:hypothetical protein